MKSFSKFFLVIISSILIYGSFYFFGKNICQRKIFDVVTSNDGKNKAVHQIIDCGATTNYSTSIMLSQNSFLSSNTNIFSLVGSYTKENITLEWETPAKLKINFAGKVTDIRQIKFLTKNVEIEVYANKEQLNVEDVKRIEEEIKKEQATYNVSLPPNEHWITN